MHSRIYQISTEPIERDDYISEDYLIDHWFTNSVADYVSDDTDRDRDIEWLKEFANVNGGLVVDSDEHGYYLMVTDKEKFFERSYKKFKETLDKIKDCSLEQFSKGISEMWTLKDAYEDKFSFYIYTDDPITLDDFVRRAELNQKLYIGATIDYHF